jgi:MFS family permease
MRFPEFEELYLKTKLQPGLVSIYSNRVIQQIAAGLIGFFTPIFLFTYFSESVQKVLLFFLITYALYGFLVPLGAMLMSKIGLKKSMIIGSLFLIGYFISLYALSKDMAFALFSTILTVTLFRFFYWVPYHTEFAESSDKPSRGREVALLVSVSALVSIFLPFLAGVVIDKFGFSILFLISVVIACTSIIPILLLKPATEKYNYSYFQTFKELFSKKNRKQLLAYSGQGAEVVIGFVIWPIFIFQLLNNNYIFVGVVSSLIILVSILLRLLIGDLSDKRDKRGIIKTGSILHAIGWIGKVFIQTGFHIFAVGAYHAFTSVIMKTPFTTLMYEQAADRGHYVDEYTVLREMAAMLGRVLMLIIVFVLLSFVSLNFAFVLAAFATLLFSIL